MNATRIRLLVLVGAVLTGGIACGPVSPGASVPPSHTPVSPTSSAVAAPPTGSIPVVPVSPHVTGTYPSSCHAISLGNGELGPDPACTPGSVQITQADAATTICNPSWTTKSVRAPQSETGPVKRASMAAYGEPANSSGNTELDHLISLELGGSNDVRNLWAEPSDIPGAGFRNKKDTVENKLHAAVCGVVAPRTSPLPLATAQQLIASNWTTALSKAGLN